MAQMGMSDLRTTNPIESTFSTIRHRAEQAKSSITRDTVLAMISKLGMAAENDGATSGASTTSPRSSPGYDSNCRTPLVHDAIHKI
ncbi:hypothetical protein SAMN05444515_12316 [Ectothiorhodospira marina]|uniref:Transposase n=1 Tax=Ectothiorhodospira marina TaxID=1396821 RepID=A0A1H7RH58_9GAMM|nr:hypothetical protein SAMN05444515_12316 [Ectothiorhodospira marina]